MATIFTKIINGEIPAYKIAEDENHLAFLDVFPIAKGHTLVIPKKEVDNIFDLPQDEFKDLFAFAQKVAKGVKHADECLKVGVSVVGLEVPHAHIHLIPINSVGDMDFNKAKLKFTQEEFESISQKIIENL
jgi:histidine triad (HIT) family protein